jgi:hypothetical protein
VRKFKVAFLLALFGLGGLGLTGCVYEERGGYGWSDHGGHRHGWSDRDYDRRSWR